MQNKKQKSILRILGGIIAMVALVLAGLLLYALINGLFDNHSISISEPLSAPQEELTMRDDIMPDMDSFYSVWDLTYAQSNGKTVALSSFRGKPLVLVYWNSWCPDCKQAIGIADQAARAAEEAGGQLILVVRKGVKGETTQSASMYLTSIGVAQKTLLDPDAAGYTRLGLHWVPSILYFNSNGMLMYTDTQGDLSSEAVKAGLYYAQNGGRASTDTLIRDRLTNAQGRIAAAFTVNADSQIKTDVALSETQGLIMRYALLIGDQTLFDLAYGYVRNSMSHGGLASWCQEGQTLSDTNATIDDLRSLAEPYPQKMKLN